MQRMNGYNSSWGITMRRTLFVILLIALSVPALAVGKITADPNAPGAAVQKTEQAEVKDTRLAQAVTYNELRKTVSAILDELTKSTGVVLKAGYNSKDWQVRDRKMTIFVKDLPLGALMNSMARVMKFKWERGGKDGAWTYRLFMDRRTLLDAEAQRVREEQRVEDEQAKRRSEGLGQYAKLGNLTPEDMAKLKTENPFLYMISKAGTEGTGMTNSMGSFFGETPMAAEAISKGQRLDIPSSTLSPNAQAGLARGLKSMMELMSKFSPGNNRRPLPDDFESNMSRMNVSINKSLEMTKGMPSAGFMLGDITVSYDGHDMAIPFIDPNSGLAKIIGKAMIESDEGGLPMDEVMKNHQTEFISTMAADIKAAVGGEPITEHPDNPALNMKVTLKPKGNKLQEIAEALADAAKFGVVSDNFNNAFPASKIPSTEVVLKDLLDKIGDTYIYNWDTHGTIIELRDRNWFKKRAAQIPEEWLEAWRQELIKTGTIDIDSLAEIAALTQEQLMSNVFTDDVLRSSGLSGTIFSNREQLRLWGSLSQVQRTALMSRDGLNAEMLSPDQSAQVMKLIQSKIGVDAVNSAKSIVLMCERKLNDDPQNNKSIQYTLTPVIDGLSLETPFHLNTPRYFPPPPKPEPAKPKTEQSPGRGKTSEVAPLSSVANRCLDIRGTRICPTSHKRVCRRCSTNSENTFQ